MILNNLNYILTMTDIYSVTKYLNHSLTVSINGIQALGTKCLTVNVVNVLSPRCGLKDKLWFMKKCGNSLIRQLSRYNRKFVPCIRDGSRMRNKIYRIDADRLH